MIPPAFAYQAPTTLPEAIALLSANPGEAKILAGGHSLLPMMKLRFAQPGQLIDLNRIDQLRGIREVAGEIRIGAMTTESQLIGSPLLRDKLPLLAEVARQIGDPQVRNRGTIGGDLAHGDPANDHPAIAIALDATLVVEGPRGQRLVKVEDFFHGLYMTDLAENEILTEIRIAPFPAGTGWAYEKLKRKTGDWATAAAAVVMRMDSGKVSAIRIALTNVAATPQRAVAAEQALLGRFLTSDSLGDAMHAVQSVCAPAEDLRGDVTYKTSMAGEMVRRAVERAAVRCI